MDIQAYVTKRLTENILKSVLFYVKFSPEDVTSLIEEELAAYLKDIDKDKLVYTPNTEIGIIISDMVMRITTDTAAPKNLSIEDAYDIAYSEVSASFGKLIFALAKHIALRLSIIKNEISIIADRLTETINTRITKDIEEKETTPFSVFDLDADLDDALMTQAILTAKQLTNTFRSTNISLSDASTILDKLQRITPITSIDDVSDIETTITLPVYLYKKNAYNDLVSNLIFKLTNIRQLSQGVLDALVIVNQQRVALDEVVEALGSYVSSPRIVETLLGNIKVIYNIFDLIKAVCFIYKKTHLKNTLILSPNTVRKNTYDSFLSEGGTAADISAIIVYYMKHSVNGDIPNYGVSLVTALANKEKYGKIVAANIPTEESKIIEYNTKLEAAIRTVLDNYFTTYYPEPTVNEVDNHNTALERIGIMIQKYNSNVSDLVLDYLISTYSTNLYTLYKYLHKTVTETGSIKDIATAILKYILYTILSKYIVKE